MTPKDIEGLDYSFSMTPKDKQNIYSFSMNNKCVVIHFGFVHTQWFILTESSFHQSGPFMIFSWYSYSTTTYSCHKVSLASVKFFALMGTHCICHKVSQAHYALLNVLHCSLIYLDICFIPIYNESNVYCLDG